MIGTTLGHYRITDKLGAGGMGEVYRAEDTTLGRAVAIKVLPESFASDPERLARFEREAKLLASLNHPSVASIHGFEQHEGTRFLVLELAEGEDLSERLKRGPIPVDEALDIAAQIAEALEEAHEKGIVHRDLKPGNVKLSPDGKVKVLDFGLAKAWAGDAAASGSSVDLSQSPTLAHTGTQAGIILGTAAYMSPEQARGRSVDKRADIWAFGIVLYEMLTGQRLFTGETASDVLAGVLKTEIDFGALPPSLPPSLRRLLRRCLERDPKRRLRDIGDAKLELLEVDAGDAAERPRAPSEPRGRRGLLLAAMLAAGLLGGWALTRALSPPAAAVQPPTQARLTVALPAEAPLAAGNFLPSLAFSPDGASLAYVSVSGDGVRRLAVRRLDSDEVRVIAGTEGAEGPFFSPSGEWIGFWAQSKVRKVRTSGVGVPEDVCRSRDFRGGTWAGHTIVFAPSQLTGLVQVDENGGQPRELTQKLPGEANHRYPQALPDGDTILFTAWSPPFDVDRSTLAAVSLSSGERKDVGALSHDVRFSPSGHLLYAQAGRLLAAPFDPGKLEITGSAKALLDRVVVQKNTGAAQFAVSATGQLAWVPGGLVGDEVAIIRVERSGRRTPLFATDTVRRYPSLSPDERELMVMAIGPEVDGEWIVSLDAMTQRRIGTETNYSTWLDDGRWVYASNANAIYEESLDGTSPRRELVPPGPNVLNVTGGSRDGTITYSASSPEGDLDAWIIGPDGEPKPFLEGPADEGGVTFSPDGRYVAYVSNRSGQFEVYVTPFPDRSATWQVSTAGGSEVIWRRDGSEITFRSGNELVAVPVTTDPTFRAGSPSVLFQVPYDGLLGSPDFPNYDVSRDGSWFVMIDNPDLNRSVPSVEIALGWPSLLGVQ